MIRLDVASVLLQWATGGLLFLWVTTRRREVGLGYGWLLRGVYMAIAIGAIAGGRVGDPVAVRDGAAVVLVVAAAVALAISIARRSVGVSGERARRTRRAARVAAMTGGDAPEPPISVTLSVTESTSGRASDRNTDRNTDRNSGKTGTRDGGGLEFSPAVDLVAPLVGAIGLVAAGLADASGTGGAHALSVLRLLVGAAFLGAVSDAMLLGHWYLVQPGLGRAPLHELNRWVSLIWPLEVGAMLLPTGMLSVLSGSIDDGYGGILGWFWVACAIATIVLSLVTTAALKERAYSAVMAATGLLYLAILTAFGTDLVARALLAG